jgi:hypothetical protein
LAASLAPDFSVQAVLVARAGAGAGRWLLTADDWLLAATLGRWGWPQATRCGARMAGGHTTANSSIYTGPATLLSRWNALGRLSLSHFRPS